MDPNAAQKRINDAKARGDRREAREAQRDLNEWIRKGGFPPKKH